MQFPAEKTLSEFFDVYGSRDEKWRDVVDYILRREGFGACKLELLSGSNLAYTVDDTYVFKAFPAETTFEGVIERDLLQACSTDPIFAAPKLVASGMDGWQWVLMTKLPGQGLRVVRSELSPADRLRVTDRLAEWAVEFRASTAVQSLRLERPEKWETLQHELRDGLVEKLRKQGLGEEWLEQVPEFYADWESVEHTAVIHADLHDMNILVSEGADGWELSGVFDFADAMHAPVMYELAAPLLFVARGVRAEVEALCMRLLGEVPDARKLLQWALLHRFSNLQYYLENFDYVGSDVTSLDEVARALAGSRSFRWKT